MQNVLDYQFLEKSIYINPNIEKNINSWLDKQSLNLDKITSLDYDYTMALTIEYLNQFTDILLKTLDLDFVKTFCIITNYFLNLKKVGS